MTCLGRGDDTPLTLGHTCLPEMDWRLITRESPDFSHGECQSHIIFLSFFPSLFYYFFGYNKVKLQFNTRGGIMKLIIPVMVGAVIGYVTNWLAIKMLFRPHEEKRIFGFHIPFTPGLIPKERSRIAKSIGETVGGYLLSPEVIMNSLKDNRIESYIKEWVGSSINKLKEEERTIRDFIVMFAKENYNSILKGVKYKTAGYILKELRKEEFKQKIRELIERSISGESMESIYTLLSSRIELFLSELKYSDKAQEFLISAIGNKLNELAQDERILREIIPDNFIDSFNSFVENNSEYIARILRDMLDDPMVENRIKESICSLASQNINRLIALFISPELIADKLYGIIKDYINKPQANEGIVEILKKAVDKILDSRGDIIFTEISSIVGEEQISGISKSILAYVSSEENLRKVLDIIFEKMESEKPEIIKTILNSLYAKIEEMLDKEELQSSIYIITDEFIENMINTPVSSMVHSVDEIMAERISGFIMDIFKYFIKARLPYVVELFNISKIVEDEINSYDVEFAEKLIVEIADRELKAITWLGALLGGIMGLLSPLLQMLYT